MPINKYSPHIKIRVAQEYLSGEKTLLIIASELGYECKNSRTPGHLTRWIKQYMAYGEAAFINPKGNSSYTKEFKNLVVEEYLSSGCSLLDLSIKYKIRNEYILSVWVKQYNNHIELKDYIPKREVYMAEAKRTTTIEERKEIVKYCISHYRDYKETASIYDVSYSQVYSWVKKYDACGEEGLLDKRGHQANVQYGSKLNGLVAALTTVSAVSINRIHEILRSVFDIHLATETISYMVSRCAESLYVTKERIRQQI